MRPEIRIAEGSPGPGSRRSRPRRYRWLAKPSARLVSTSVLAAMAIIFATPASGGMAARFVKAVGFGPSPSQNGASFSGTPAVGALFTVSARQARQPFLHRQRGQQPARGSGHHRRALRR